LNLVPDQFPAFVIEDVVTGDTAPFDQDEEITTEKIEEFVANYFAGKEEVREQNSVSQAEFGNIDMKVC
jgi:hypothetical protein